MAEQLKFEVPVTGFGSYAKGIIPDDQAVLAGAFSTSMLQINQIRTVDFETFASIVFSLETNNGLPLTNGTNIPANEFLVDTALTKTALGSGVYGTYTTSDFIGAMTGLPYAWRDIKQLITTLQTRKLDNIYDQLYLAVNWEPATGTVSYATRAVQTSSGPDLYKYEYRITGVSLTNSGGGYWRGTAPVPSVTVSGTYYFGTGGAGFNITYDNNSSNVPGTYGQILSLVLDPSGDWVEYASGQTDPDPNSLDPGLVLEIECPPTADLPVQTDGNFATGGTNTPSGTDGWSTAGSDMDYVVNRYIDQANDEIYNIQTGGADNFTAAKALNTLWNSTGIALKIEQRSRFYALPPVPIPYYPWMARFPVTLYNFVDTIPTSAVQTEPHGPAQSLEQIADFCTIGGQSLIAMMRQERNQQRLGQIGIELDNNIPMELSEQQQKILAGNGVLPDAVEGIETPAGTFTLPAYVDKELCDGTPITTLPLGFFDPNDLNYQFTDDTGPGNIYSILNIANLGPYGDLTGPGYNIPIAQIGTVVSRGPVIESPRGTNPGPTFPDKEVLPNPPTDGTLGLPGTLWPNLPVLPISLQLPYLNTLPANYGVGQAIDNVIECNCDCWI